MTVLKMPGLDPSFTNPQEAKWHDSVIKCFAYDPQYADMYVPNDEDMQYCPDPDPRQFAARAHVSTLPRNNDPLYHYMDTHKEVRSLQNLPWAVLRYLFSKGYTPNTARSYLGEIAMRRLLVGKHDVDMTSPLFYQCARAVSSMYYPELMEAVQVIATGKALPPLEPALVVMSDIVMGRVIQEPERLRGSISNQLLAMVDIGPDKSQGSSGHNLTKQIVCAGIPVLQSGDQVAIALPGSMIGRRGNGPGGYKSEKVRMRGFHVGRRKQRSEALMLSRNEACGRIGPYKGVFYDDRNSDVNEVLKIPRVPGLSPGTRLDDITLFSHGGASVVANHNRRLSEQRNIIDTFRKLVGGGMSGDAAEDLMDYHVSPQLEAGPYRSLPDSAEDTNY